MPKSTMKVKETNAKGASYLSEVVVARCTSLAKSAQKVIIMKITSTGPLSTKARTGG